MKRILITATAVAALASPVLAQTQLERQLGVAPGQYSLSQLVELKGASDGSGNSAIVNIDGVRVNAETAHATPYQVPVTRGTLMVVEP